MIKIKKTKKDKKIKEEKNIKLCKGIKNIKTHFKTNKYLKIIKKSNQKSTKLIYVQQNKKLQ